MYNVAYNDAVYRIKQDRKEKGLFVFKQIILPDHPLIGTTFIHPDGKTVVIENAYLEWWNGYFLVKVLYADSCRSHGVRYIHKWQQFYRKNDAELIDIAMKITSTVEIEYI